MKDPEPKPKPAEDTTPKRKAVYVRLNAVSAQVETAAVKKFGRKPTKDDNLGVTLLYNAFVERETEKALDALSKEVGLLRFELSAIQREGDKEGWPKK